MRDSNWLGSLLLLILVGFCWVECERSRQHEIKIERIKLESCKH